MIWTFGGRLPKTGSPSPAPFGENTAKSGKKGGISGGSFLFSLKKIATHEKLW
ncbi:MAG TPA: hypothetical protein IAD19_00790 [Candidatus Egerieicola faecale]|uniref:Uncharacterized protein n=1 Tax=Candidatus Egerieicola faecale TaxID=2840774 RepID=A0A9D1IQV0_9FIRM|nr:hypothetical protein [Candidatus Egerieicola faecale]